MPWTRSTNLKGPSMLRLARLPAALSTDSDTSWLTLFTTPLAAQQVLSFSAELYFSSDANKAGLVTTLTGPDGPEAVIHNLVTGESLTTFRNLTASSYDTPLIGTSSAGSSVLRAQVSGTVENGATAGDLSLHFRSEVAGRAVTVLRGSWWEVLQH
jgi:hypothetical protein